MAERAAKKPLKQGLWVKGCECSANPRPVSPLPVAPPNALGRLAKKMHQTEALIEVEMSDRTWTYRRRMRVVGQASQMYLSEQVVLCQRPLNRM